MRIRALTGLYAKLVPTTAGTEMQNRFSIVVVLLSLLVEPMVYLAVWTAVATQSGGAAGGMSVGAISAYFIVWMLVRIVASTFTPFGFETRIRRGDFTGHLLRPVHPIHYDLAYFIGLKVPMLLMWLPVATLLVLLFHPALSPNPLAVAVFAVALCGAYMVRSLYMWLMGLVNFWTTRTAALFDFVLLVELLLSGRLVPMSFMPEWVQSLSRRLPFYWAFGFPIETVVGNLDTAELVRGLGMQVLWMGIGSALVAVTWRRAVRRYDAVGN